ncbi:MAG: sensor histidine kinase, partial [Chloroflexi bacterium]|nr:sensor histidine kinase [Chloroflexota bacterium]
AVLPLVFAEYFFPASLLNPQNWNIVFSTALSLFTLAVLIYVPVYRYRNISNPTVRQQTKWVVYGISIALLGFFITAFPSSFNYPQLQLGTFLGMLQVTGLILFFLLIPLSIGVAILRFRLWDIDPIINRTLVYGTLSFLTVLFYAIIVGFFANYFRNSQTNIIVSFIATGIIAVLFEPLRRQLQRGVNRLMYGERDNPATVLTRLSQRLDSALAPDSVLQTIVETLAQTLKLPYAAISFLDEEPRFNSTRDLPPSELIRLPLTHQTERVGELALAPRAVGESFSPTDMKLIHLIAQQAGVAAYTLRLNKDLQKSRERLVTVQEEERRRLRRDLHDGVGPTLASLSQRIDTAAEWVKHDPEKSVELLKTLKGQVRETVAEIRRLVYALRPPVLDEFGLVSAIREHTAQYSGPNGLQITFDVTEPLPTLPAAVEVAAYRIVLEAFTNAVRHARATACRIQIKIENQNLLLEVSDNGNGLPKDNRAGVGFTSMRERAEELGGGCVIENNKSGGVTVRARLPISASHQTG